MSFQGKYRILSALGNAETHSFRAVQISSGRPVLIHHLAAGQASPPQPDLASLIFKLLVSGSPGKNQFLLDMGEDEGRIFVVTADVPECVDLRQWLLSVTEPPAGKEGTAQPAEGTPAPRSSGSTSTFTSEALWQVEHSSSNAPVLPTAVPDAAQPAVPTPEKSPEVWTPPPRIAPASFRASDTGPTNFAGFWEKTSLGSFAGQPATFPTPPTSPKSGEAPSEAPSVTAEFLSKWASSGIQDAPTTAMPTLQGQAADRKAPRAPAAESAEGRSNADRVADVMLRPPEVARPSAATGVGEVFISPIQADVTPAPDIAETKVPQLMKELIAESDNILPQAAASASPPQVGGPADAAAKPVEKVARRQPSMGFELVFQSTRPRKSPTLSGAPPDQSGIMAAPASVVPQTAPEEPAPAAKVMPEVAPTMVIPPALKFGDSPAGGLPPVPEVSSQVIGARSEPAAPPSPPQAVPQSERATRFVPSSSPLPERPAPQAPAGPAVPPPGPLPRVATPLPAPPNRAQAGEYTRMIENIKSVASPLAAVVPPGVAPAGAQSTPALPAAAPLQSSYLRIPTPQPPLYHEAPLQLKASTYIASDAPAHLGSKHRKAWVPILILMGLFLMTVGLLLFFALKH